MNELIELEHNCSRYSFYGAAERTAERANQYLQLTSGARG